MLVGLYFTVQGVIAFVMVYGYPPFHGQTKGGGMLISPGENEWLIRKNIQRGFDPTVRRG